MPSTIGFRALELCTLLYIPHSTLSVLGSGTLFHRLKVSLTQPERTSSYIRRFPHTKKPRNLPALPKFHFLRKNVQILAYSYRPSVLSYRPRAISRLQTGRPSPSSAERESGIEGRTRGGSGKCAASGQSPSPSLPQRTDRPTHCNIRTAACVRAPSTGKSVSSPSVSLSFRRAEFNPNPLFSTS